jgi:threonine synthase
VLVATSGDTGGAVANGFYNVDGVDVIILYPSGKVSSIQELQLTTLGNNITALEINGNFDDCQNLVKQAFADSELNSRVFLTSANSINVARWLPQQFIISSHGSNGLTSQTHPSYACPAAISEIFVPDCWHIGLAFPLKNLSPHAMPTIS